MNALTPDQIRDRFLRFFERHGHRVVASSPVVPEGDPTLLFTNAGMNQFKDVLLGLEKRDYVRAASVQKCIRAGGKHNDLDEVGRDGRHLTFFEMLGNWSFGEYYKRESIRWGWEFITQELGLPAERVYVSVFEDDDESYRIWHEEIGLERARIVRLGEKDNFWAMGPTGPCGPCTEIYFDHHPEHGAAVWEPGFDDERFVEIWNHVFMEFDRAEDGTLTPLPMQSVDTGMGLDRVAAVMAGVDNVFRTGLFARILVRTHELLTGDVVPVEQIHASPSFKDYCVIADHVRTVGFSICDGAVFANDGRGYVLRRILRRAVRHGRNLGFDGPFLCDVLDAVVETFQHVYPELRFKHRDAKTIIRTEEERFFRTLDRGIALFDELARAAETGAKRIAGDDVFKLYDTFGFPPDLTAIMAEERGLTIDHDGYEAAMERQRERSRAADDRYANTAEWVNLQDGVADRFVGYDRLDAVTDVLRYRVGEDGTVEVCLRETPFYSESGGQVGDRGTITSADGSLVLEVTTTQKTTAGITHIARIVSGELRASALREPVAAAVDARARQLAACNHTATHLLHAALHRFVSEKAFQAGSLVAPERLRFDFSHDRPLSDDQLASIEAYVNAAVRADYPVVTRVDVPLADAESMGAMMIFGEKYGEKVRVVDIAGSGSVELCGGTHVKQTSEIAYFRVVSEGGVAAGVRRIEAVTNERAFAQADADRATLEALADSLKTVPAQLPDRVAKLLEQAAELEKKVADLTRAAAKSTAAELLDAAVDVGGVRAVAARVDVLSRDALLTIADHLREKLGGDAVALLGAELDGKPALLALATDGAVARGLKAGDLVNEAAALCGGKGGGKPTLAQAGGTDVGGLDAAVGGFVERVRARVG
jgi:alanyl-tRNA synthetase